jgi:hypothetical protein
MTLLPSEVGSQPGLYQPIEEFGVILKYSIHVEIEHLKHESAEGTHHPATAMAIPTPVATPCANTLVIVSTPEVKPYSG